MQDRGKQHETHSINGRIYSYICTQRHRKPIWIYLVLPSREGHATRNPSTQQTLGWQMISSWSSWQTLAAQDLPQNLTFMTSVVPPADIGCPGFAVEPNTYDICGPPGRPRRPRTRHGIQCLWHLWSSWQTLAAQDLLWNLILMIFVVFPLREW